jgi:hypothetical protein
MSWGFNGKIEKIHRKICKFCRHYWTNRGSLRNVHVDGGTRKASSSSVAFRNPKRSKNSKRCHITPALDPAPVGMDDTSNSNRDLPMQAAATVDTEDGFKSTTSVALRLGVTDDVQLAIELRRPGILLGRRRVRRHRSSSVP